jgi:hypothetical protein
VSILDLSNFSIRLFYVLRNTKRNELRKGEGSGVETRMDLKRDNQKRGEEIWI